MRRIGGDYVYVFKIEISIYDKLCNNKGLFKYSEWNKFYTKFETFK